MLEPLDDLLGTKDFVFSDTRPSSLDCMMLGHLGLAMVDDLPTPWLAETIRDRFPRLEGYVRRLRGRCWGDAVVDVDVLLQGLRDHSLHPTGTKQLDSAQETDNLPWRPTDPTDLLTISTLLLHDVLTSLPIAKHLYSPQTLLTPPPEPTAQPSPPLPSPPSSTSKSLLLPAAGLISGIALLAGTVLFTSLPTTSGSTSPFSSVTADERRKRRLDDFGDAGAALSVLPLGGRKGGFGGDMEMDGEGMRDGGIGDGREPVAEVGVAIQDRGGGLMGGGLDGMR